MEQYTKYQILKGVAKPLYPHDKNDCVRSCEKGIRWAEWNKQHAYIQYHAFDHGGNPMVDGVFSRSEFGEPIPELFCCNIDGEYEKCNPDCHSMIKTERLSIYQKPPVEKPKESVGQAAEQYVSQYKYHQDIRKESFIDGAKCLEISGYKSPVEVRELLRQAFEAGDNYGNRCACGECDHCNSGNPYEPDFDTWITKHLKH